MCERCRCNDVTTNSAYCRDYRPPSATPPAPAPAPDAGGGAAFVKAVDALIEAVSRVENMEDFEHAALIGLTAEEATDDEEDGRAIADALTSRAHVLALRAADCDAARNDGWHAGLVEGRSQGLAKVDAACDVLSADGEEIAIVRMDDGAWGVATVYDLNVDALDIDADDVSPTAAILAAAAALTPADDAGAGGGA